MNRSASPLFAVCSLAFIGALSACGKLKESPGERRSPPPPNGIVASGGRDAGAKGSGGTDVGGSDAGTPGSGSSSLEPEKVLPDIGGFSIVDESHIDFYSPRWGQAACGIEAGGEYYSLSGLGQELYLLRTALPLSETEPSTVLVEESSDGVRLDGCRAYLSGDRILFSVEGRDDATAKPVEGELVMSLQGEVLSSRWFESNTLRSYSSSEDGWVVANLDGESGELSVASIDEDGATSSPTLLQACQPQPIPLLPHISWSGDGWVVSSFCADSGSSEEKGGFPPASSKLGSSGRFSNSILSRFLHA